MTAPRRGLLAAGGSGGGGGGFDHATATRIQVNGMYPNFPTDMYEVVEQWVIVAPSARIWLGGTAAVAGGEAAPAFTAYYGDGCSSDDYGDFQMPSGLWVTDLTAKWFPCDSDGVITAEVGDEKLLLDALWYGDSGVFNNPRDTTIGADAIGNNVGWIRRWYSTYAVDPNLPNDPMWLGISVNNLSATGYMRIGYWIDMVRIG